MWRNLTVNLADLLFSVSEAMDLSDSSLVDHQIRTAFVSFEIARAARLEYSQAERLFVAALLHDIGALSPEEKIGAHILEDVLPEPHCRRGAKLFREAFWLEPSASIIEWHHTTIEAHACAGRSIGNADVLAAQIVFLADHLERAIRRDEFILHQSDRLREHIRGLGGAAIHPDVVDLFDEVARAENFWLELVSKDLSRHLRDRNLLRAIDLDYAAARSIASVFKDMTDFRSRFTATHSTGVAACARGLGELLTFTGKDLQQIELAGLLHDIGKLVVPNTILCKPTRLSPQQYAVIQQHPYFTQKILSRVRGFEQIAEWASCHHERLDGSGYCERLERDELDVGAKIIAVADVATAIAERRPYRGPGDETAVLAALTDMAARGLLEPMIVEALADNYHAIMSGAQAAQSSDEARYLKRYAMTQ